MPNMIQLNYEDLQKFIKYFHNEGDDTLQLLSDTRQRVQGLHNEWSGDAADAFFSEMEGELLPALKRLAHALDFAQDKLGSIVKIIHEADQEAAGNFKKDDFGAGRFGDALGGLPGQTAGGAGAGNDFGAGKFGEAVPDAQPGGGGTPTGDDFGAGKFGEAGQTPGDSGKSDTPLAPGEEAATETPETTPEAAASGGGGGGGGGGSSQGMQGDLGLGKGMVGAQQNAFVGGAAGGAESLPDHDFGGGSSGGGGGGAGTPGGAPAGGGGDQASSSGGGAAAGIAGVAGSAAVGSAAKAVKDKKEQDS